MGHVKNFFDPDLMGALPDVRVEVASVENWQAVFDLVQTQGWKWEYSVGDGVVPLPPASEVLARPADAELPIFRVWPVPGVLVNLWPYSAVEIDFDIDLREPQGQQRLDMLCEFFAAIGPTMSCCWPTHDCPARRNAARWWVTNWVTIGADSRGRPRTPKDSCGSLTLV